MNNLIKTFVRNPVAPNLAMIVMVLAGLWASTQLTRQVLPAFALNLITISVVWQGAAAQDVEASLTQPIEDQLLGLEEIKNISSVSRDNRSTVTLEYPQGTDMSAALNKVKNSVSFIRNLPVESEQPQIALFDRNAGVSRLLLTGPVLEQLRPISKQFERQLRARGLSRVEIRGLPEEEISIELPAERLNELKLSLTEIAQQIRGTSINLPAGAIGEKDMSRQLRSLDQQRSVEGFSQLVINPDGSGRLLTLGDIASIERAPKENSAQLFSNNKPAVEIIVARSESEDAINVAENLGTWIEGARADLPPNIELTIYDERWRNVDDRINLMTSNALTGLVLLLGILYLFLNGRVAIWVAAGIPVSILASLMALSYFGGTINVMTLFAMIMTLGIIVDDAIVVSEEAVTLADQGASPARAAEQAAIKMLPPVAAASLTTVAAFLPLMTIGGPTGSILFAIPLVVICVVLASLLECFIVLPGHLHHSLKISAEHQPSKLRRTVDGAFTRFREEKYLPAVRWCVENR
ncbi:MAG: multidrug efflux pump subunit AcrB, partial [Oceanicoccus sp.]